MPVSEWNFISSRVLARMFAAMGGLSGGVWVCNEVSVWCGSALRCWVQPRTEMRMRVGGTL